MNTLRNLAGTVARSPILWGVLAAIGFYGLVHGGPLATPLVERYFTGHPVEYMETVIFAVGLAALVLKALETAGQYAALAHCPLGPAEPALAAADQCDALLERLDRLPARRQQEYYVRRLREAIEYVRARGSSEGLDDELKYLADNDAGRVHASYGLFRVIVWAIPILGFLGTVIGITMALNSVDLQAPDQSMVHVLTGLGLKFDTTALALSLSMVLMFVHFFIDRAEAALLGRVDQRAARELGGRFPQLPAGPDGQLLAVRRMAETVLQATERLVQRQAELWQASLKAAEGRWTQLTESSGARLQAALSAALTEALKAHAGQLAAAEQSAAQQFRRYWEKSQQDLCGNVQAVSALQAAVVQQAQQLQQVLAATGEVTRLEEVLNRNLAALAGARHFEQTVHSLAAAIHLLSARLSESPAAVPMRLESPRRSVQAA